MKSFGRFWRYLKTHIWFQVSGIFMVSIVGITLCYQAYMREAYEDFLVEKNHLMESAVLDTMQMNLDYTMKEYINIGAQIAVNQNIYELTKRLLTTREDPARDYMILKMNFTAMANYSKNLINISAASGDGEIYQYDRLLRGNTSMWKAEDAKFLRSMYERLYEKANDREAVQRYIVSTEYGRHPTNNERVFHIFYPIVGRENSFSQMQGMLCLTFSMDVFKPFMDVFSEEEGAYSKAYITAENGTVIYHSNAEYLGKQEEEYRGDRLLLVLDKPLEKVDWKLHISLDREQLNKSVMEIIAQGMGVYVFLLLLVACIFYFILRKIVKPIKRIENAMRQTVSGYGQGREKVIIEGGHEIWKLAQGYNEMIDRLVVREQEVERSYQLSIAAIERQHQAEREALETQINSHFLCNTLGTINYEAMECGNFKVSKLIKKLSNILRYTFDQKCQNVYMYQEFAWIDQYCFLMKARLEDVFDYEIEFDESCANWPCCKLMLQPFVENAILHGFEGRETGGKLRILAKRQGKRLFISITDNGCGMAAQKRDKIQEALDGESVSGAQDIGIGVRNAASRIRIFYGNEVRMKVKSAADEGTRFGFLVPRLFKREEVTGEEMRQ